MHAAIFQIFYQLTLTFWEIFVQCKICSLRVFTNLVNLRNVHNFFRIQVQFIYYNGAADYRKRKEPDGAMRPVVIKYNFLPNVCRTRSL